MVDEDRLAPPLQIKVHHGDNTKTKPTDTTLGAKMASLRYICKREKGDEYYVTIKVELRSSTD